MQSGREILDRMFLEMRWRALSLAADLDRVERAAGGAELLDNDPRIQKLFDALRVLSEEKTNRAEQVQMIFSDLTPPPMRISKADER